MIDFTIDINEDLEKTQGLPVLTGDVQLDGALARERDARIEIVELMRQNLTQAKEIEQLRDRQLTVVASELRISHSSEPNVTVEERLFEVCGALKNTLSTVLTECAAQRVGLNCESSANRVLLASCDELEEILSAPGFSAQTVPHDEAPRKAVLAFRRRARRLE